MIDKWSDCFKILSRLKTLSGRFGSLLFVSKMLVYSSLLMGIHIVLKKNSRISIPVRDGIYFEVLGYLFSESR